MTKYLIGVALLVLVAYGSIEAWPLIKGPGLSITSPVDQESFPDGIVAITGTAARATSVVVNGTPLFHDQNGDFSSILTFPRGSSILTFTVADRFGRRITQTRTIFVP